VTAIVLDSTQLATMFKALPTVIDDIRAGKAPLDVFRDVEPSLLPIFETIAGDLFPFGGLAVDVVALAVLNSKQLSPGEQKIYDDAYSARVQAT